MGIRELSPELKNKAQIELYENSERIHEDINTIKEWLNKQPHIKARMDDQWLVSFLRGCKYSIEKTKEKLDMFYTMKTAIPEVSKCVSTKEADIQELLRLGVLLPLLKTKKPDDPKVILVRPGIFNAAKISITSVMRLGQMILNIQMKDDDQVIIAGQMYVVDSQNVGFSLLTQMNPALLKKIVISRQSALPIREKGAHHINLPKTAEKFLIIMKSFMNEKSRSRLHIHSDMESLYSYVPKSILPEEYGGNEGPIQNLIDYWKKRVEENEDFFADEMQYKTDETKRPGSPKTADTLFGIEGSFRQLNVD